MRRASRSPILLAIVAGLLAASAAPAQTRPRSTPRPSPAVAAPTQAPAPAAAPAPSRALAISHEEMGCVIVGKFPQFSACFDPAGDLAKAEMFFRSEKNTSWYRVPFKLEGACHKATLPKPAKMLLNTNVLLYASGASRQWGEARTREYSVKVVASEGECKGDKPVAAWLPSANVAVFPSLPLGFAAGGAALPVVPIVGGAVLAGGGAAAASGAFGGEEAGNDEGDGPGGGGTSTTTPTPTAAPANTPTPTPPPSTTNLPPTLVCRTSPDPATGPAPLAVELNLCRSEDPEGRPLSFRFDFGDGGAASGFCRENHTYTRVGNYTARMCVSDEVNPEQCCSERIVVNEAATPTPPGGGSCARPSISVNSPSNGEIIGISRGTYKVVVTPDAPAGIARVDFKATGRSGSDTFTKTAPPWEWVWDLNKTGLGEVEVGGTVHDKCSSGSQQASASVKVTVTSAFAPDEAEAAGAPAIASELAVPDGTGRILHNDSRLAFLRSGRSVWMQKAAAGANRIEAVVAQAAGAGTWRFSLAGGSFRSGSLRILEGEPALVTVDTIVFRLGGRAGERVVFTFEPAP